MGMAHGLCSTLILKYLIVDMVHFISHPHYSKVTQMEIKRIVACSSKLMFESNFQIKVCYAWIHV